MDRYLPALLLTDMFLSSYRNGLVGPKHLHSRGVVGTFQRGVFLITPFFLGGRSPEFS